MSDYTQFDLGYAMGIIAGEGSFTGDWKDPNLQVRLHQRDIAVLQFLRRMFGGQIYGPYFHGNRHYSFWRLRGKELEKLLPILEQHLPESFKREQFLTWLEKYGHLKRLLDVSHPVTIANLNPSASSTNADALIDAANQP